MDWTVFLGKVILFVNPFWNGEPTKALHHPLVRSIEMHVALVLFFYLFASELNFHKDF